MNFADQPASKKINPKTSPANICHSETSKTRRKTKGDKAQHDKASHNNALHNPQSLQEKLELFKADELSAKNFAHLVENEAVGVDGEMRAALCAINIYAETLRDGCEDVLAHYPAEIKNLLVRLSETLLKKSRQAQYLLNNFLFQLQCVTHNELNKKNFSSYSITQNIEKTLTEYPFKAQERELIQFEQDYDFTYWGDLACTNHVLFSLIKNSLFSSGDKKQNKNKISIKLAKGRDFNQLIFESTTNHPFDIRLPLLHNYFALTDNQASNSLCLAFIKVVMKSYNGTIVYSAFQKYGAKIVLNFPQLR